MPDTPRWYLRAGRRAEAKATLAKTVGGPDVDGRLDTMQAELAETSGVTWKDVFAESAAVPGMSCALGIQARAVA